MPMTSSTKPVTRFVILALGVTLTFSAALAQIIAPPTLPAEPSTTPTAPTAVPTTLPATTPTTLPSAERVLENLLQQAPANPVIAPTGTNPTATPLVPGVAPNQPTVKRVREGQFVWNRTGRLVKEEKTGQWLFAFEADGKEMKDPPMGLLPSMNLEQMERLSDGGVKAVRFKISGQVTEYHGKNFLLVTAVQTVRDMNQF